MTMGNRRYKNFLLVLAIACTVIYSLYKLHPASEAGRMSLLVGSDSVVRYGDSYTKTPQDHTSLGSNTDTARQHTPSSEGTHVPKSIQNINAHLIEQHGVKGNDLDKLILATKNKLSFSSDALATLHNTFAKIFKIYHEYQPQVKKLDSYKSEERIRAAVYEREDVTNRAPFTREFLRNFLDVDSRGLREMKRSHKKVVEKLPEHFPQGLFKGNGIVYVGGGKYSWLVLLSIKELRRLGSKLPVEVFIPKFEEYELQLCGEIFPALNAKCVLLPHVFGEQVIKNFQFFGYQYKALAILASSFENVLLLDSDNLPVLVPDGLFDSEPYASNGLICWPDFWKRTTSPHFYDIAGVTIKDKRVRFGYQNYGIYQAGIIANNAESSKEIPLHDLEGAIPDPTTESGQLVISKSIHAKTLLLSLYYNIWGPTHYYSLLSQGSDGEGDKETFLAAAVVLGKPYYQVNKWLAAFGHFNVKRDFIGVGMGQFDPVGDYEGLNKNLKVLAKADQKFTSYEEANEALQKIPGIEGVSLAPAQPKLLFVHANFPKLDPFALMKSKKSFLENGERVRLFGEDMGRNVGFDFELNHWEVMHNLLCEDRIEVAVFKGLDRIELCGELAAQIQFLKDTSRSMKG